MAIAAIIYYAATAGREPKPASTPAVVEAAATAANALEATLGDSVVIGPGSDAATPVRGKPAKAVSADAVALLQLSIAKSWVAAGDTVHARLDAFDDAGVRVTTHQMVWTTSDPRIVHFAAPGELVTVREGNATITVTAGSASTSLPVAIGAKGSVAPARPARPTKKRR